MPNYRRILMPGGIYFFTVVTYNRRPMLIDEMAREVLREAISLVRNNQPFKIDAFCLLPDHIHTIWTLPEGDFNYSQRWRAIKGNFSRRYREQVEGFLVSNRSRQTRRELAFWQRRFWEHHIRDECDFIRHCDYIHFNPVKHGLVDCVLDWPWSSFHRYVRQGVYPMDWGRPDQVEMDMGTVAE
ncbi:MAG: transposase [Candidatus Thiodiazotropha endolucinida]